MCVRDTTSTDYNPAAKKDCVAAKIWELLRRNPLFRHRATCLSQSDECYKPGRENRLATYTLQWLFQPHFEEASEAWEFLSSTTLSGTAESQLLELFPYLTDDEVGEFFGSRSSETLCKFERR
jgi:hypothetical protein